MPLESGALEGKVALVTGGAKGIGRSVTDRIARLGAHVIINYCHAEEAAKETEEELLGRGASVELIRSSVAREKSVRHLFEQVANRWPALDILVNNAASGAFGSIRTLTEKDWTRAVDTNLYGTLRCSRSAAAMMHRGGVICNLSSTGAHNTVPGYAAVGTTKAAVEALTRYLADEFAPLGIRVNCASAGPLDTPALSALAAGDSVHDSLVARTPAARLGKGEDLARLVGFLVSPESDWIRGQTVVADGGLTLSSWPARDSR
ncbi:Enoyl-[acyl-carrier-protein] reductase [NADPH] FabL [Amycolatopsis sp. M39]|nr:SDR family oxidoreductase [Amycolatopsis rubida]OAP21124.1 Enoyl-[acyl-carrier-protein] reductase [NADPH] FabL [Amycolatopsis sp. M39]